MPRLTLPPTLVWLPFLHPPLFLPPLLWEMVPTLPVVGTGYSTLPGPFRLNNVLLAPDIIKNLLSVRQFTTDNCLCGV